MAGRARARPARRHPGAATAAAGGPGRQRVCEEAARIMTEDGIRDFQLAKRKACERLDLRDQRHWPSNAEIEAAVAGRLRLFSADRRAELHRDRTRIAVEAMRLMADFRPRAVGAVLSGNFTASTPVELHIFAELMEDVPLFLDSLRIPCEQFDRRIRYGGKQGHAECPGVRFRVEDVGIEMLIFPPEGLREAPLSQVDGRPMRRASLAEIEALSASLQE